MREISFWFDYSCPYAYLGSTLVARLAGRAGATVVYEPMLLGGVFRAVGTAQNLMNVLSPAKAAHNARDMMRWAELFGVELRIPPEHPRRTVEALRATLITGCDSKVIDGFFRAYWVDGRAPSDEATIRDVLSAAGHDADAVLAKLDDAAVKDDLRTRTDRAIALGIFGAPAYVVDGQLYWGQDRMHFVEAALRAEPSRPSDDIPRGRQTTMAHTLDVYFDFSSPFAYLGCAQIDALAKRTGATVTWKPMLLGGVFRSIGQVDVPLSTWSEAKRQYTFKDMLCWAVHWGTPFNWPSRFPMNSIKALRCYLALPEARRPAFREATFRAYWAEDRDISDEAVLRELIGEGADEVIARTGSPEIKAALKDATDGAVAAGVFGAPTFVVDGGELFWGQDRLPLVEAALTR
jgi:2-hydroxychromene-2-carboxylate isomerase